MPKRKRKNDDGTKKEIKYKGVYKSGKRFKAVITIDREGHYLGTFDTSREAAQAYDHAAIQAGHPISKLNFLDQVPKLYKPKNSGLNPRNTTGFRGVCNNGNRVQAQIQIEKEHTILVSLTQQRKLPLHMILPPSKQNVQHQN